MSARLDEEAVGRVILAAWAAEHDTHELRDQLASDIQWIYALHEAGPDLESDSRSRKRTEMLVEVSRKATELAALVGDTMLNASLTSYFSHRRDDTLSDAIEGLRKIAVAARKEVERRRDGGFGDRALLGELDSNGGTKLGSSVDFVSQLASVFEATFGKSAVIAYSTAREPGGPFLEFVIAVMNEMEAAGSGRPMAGTTTAIEQAVKRWRRLSDKSDEI